MLNKWELTRYSRNILLTEVGRAGQEKLKNASVGVIGAGGLGSPVLFYLTASGIGKLSFVDSDIVDLTNLQRQILFTTEQVGHSKAESARDVLSQLNPLVQFEPISDRLQAENVQEILGGLDCVIEGSDNFATKFLINDFCVLNSIPFLIGGILGFEGQVIGVVPGITACYRCVFEEMPPADSVPTCSEAGVIGSVAGVIGSTMASIAINHLLGIGDPLGGFILSFDLKFLTFRKIPLKKNPRCKVCGDKPIILEIESSNYLSNNIC